MSKYRIEKDSLGAIKVPLQALYGAQTQRAIENFDYWPESMNKRFIRVLLLVKKAAAKSNNELGELEGEVAQAIEKAITTLLDEDFSKHFPVSVYQTGSGTSSNMNANEVIASVANNLFGQQIVHPNDHVNRGQSSNDVIPTTTQLSMAVATVEDLLPAIDLLVARLEQLRQEHREIIKTGRTHLMDAMPISLGEEWGTWLYQIKESRERIIASLGRLTAIPLGGTAVGTGINRHQDYPVNTARILSELLKLPITICDSSSSRMSSQDALLEFHGQLKVLATVLIKHSNDLRWMNSGPNAGLSEITLEAVQPGSSIMPAKVNPVFAESIIMMCTKVMGNDTVATVANQSGNFQLNVTFPLVAQTGLESIDLLTASLTTMATKALNNISVNQDHIARTMALNPILVTALNKEIGYDQAAAIAKQAVKEERPLIEVAKEQTQLSKEQLEEMLDPSRLAFPFAKD